MAIPIFDARFMLRVKTLGKLRKMQQQQLAALRSFGVDVKETEITDPVYARVEANRWLFDCACGSGVAACPEWPEARCMGDGCGRVYTNVQYPAEMDAIVTELTAQPPERRYCYPGETAADVKQSGEDDVDARYSRHVARVREGRRG